MSQIDKFNKRFSQLRKNPQTSQEDFTAQPEPQTQAPTQPQVQVQAPAQPQPQAKKDEDKKTPKNTAPRAKKADEKQTQPLFDHTLPEDVAKDLHDYIYSAADDDFSNTVNDYIEAKDAKPREKVPHTLNLVDYMWDECKKREPDLNRAKVTDMAVMLYYSNDANPKVAAKVEKFLTYVAKTSANSYSRAVKQRYGDKATDEFLMNLAEAKKTNVPNNDTATLWDKLAEEHVKDVFEKIENIKDKDGNDKVLDDKQKARIQRNKLRYARFLRDNDFKQYLSDELLSALEADDKQKSDKQKQTKDKKSESNTGDKPMTDTNEEVTGTPTETEEEKKKKEGEEKTDTNKFNPSEVQKKACAIAGLDATKYENKDQLNDALLGAGVIINGEQILIRDGSTDAIEKAKEMDPENKDDKVKVVNKEEFDKAKKEMLTEQHKDKPLNVKETGAEEEKEPQIDRTWIEKKIENYKAMEAENKIGKINVTQGLNKEDKEFEVEVDGGTIHYSSPDNVSISNDAQIKTFEAVLMEDDNVGRPINFGENMPHDMAVRLAAACVLHDNKMIGAKPELTPEDMQMLQSELGERFEEFNKKFQEMNKPEEEKTDEGKGGEKKEEKTDEGKGDEKIVITSPDELKKFLDDAQKASIDLKKKKEDGDISFETDSETKKTKAVAGPNLEKRTDLNDEQKKQLVDDANEKVNLIESIKDAHDKYNKQKIEKLRSKMDATKLAEHDALRGTVITDEKGNPILKDGKQQYHTSAERKARVEKIQEEMSVKLGLSTDPKGEIKALSGKELDDYIGQGKVTIKNYADLWKKAHEGKAFDVKNLNPEEKSVFMQISKTQLARTNFLKGKDNSNTK